MVELEQSKNLVSGFRYRPEIDGLRGVAILAVLLYHARLGVGGGFIGVDVFFVLSGYLIVSLIFTDLQEGKFSMMQFWERRARRIIPAVFVLVAAVLAAGWFLLLPDDYVQLAKSASFQSVFAANIYFWKTMGYFAGPAEQMPLLHTWSLSVEEQFYLVVPFVLSVLFRFPRICRRWILLGLFGLGITISFVASAYGAFHSPAATFYLLPTRAWELMFGAFVALLPTASRGLKGREVLAWISMCLMIVPCFTYTDAMVFPGLAALPPCFGTALFIWATGGETGVAIPKAGRLLANRPIVFVGLISYSLYLWHWPFFAFTSYWFLRPIPLFYRVILALVAFPLAVLSWKFVETPFRKRAFLATRPRMLLGATAGLATVFSAAFLINSHGGIPARLPKDVRVLASAKHSIKDWGDLTTEDVRKGRLIMIGTDETNAPISGIVWGDSHAMAMLPAFDAYFKEIGWNGRAATHPATPPILGYWGPSKWWDGKQTIAFNDAVVDYVRRCNPTPANVFLVAYWGEYPSLSPDKKSEFTSSLMRTIEQLRSTGTQPWVMLQVPDQPVNPIHTLALSCLTHKDYTYLLARPSQFNGVHSSDLALIKRIQAAGAKIIDPRPSFYDSQLGVYPIQKDGVLIYCDRNHITTEGALKYILPLIRQQIRPPTREELEGGAGLRSAHAIHSN